jgi:membrane associated rhomboid family serine protease
MFFFPLRTDRRLKHKPWVNYALIACCVGVFLMQLLYRAPGGPWENPFLLNPSAPLLHQFFTYQFLHGGWEHLILNMLFLYVFGNSLEDRFGPLGYLGFYLSGGVVAGIGHCLVSENPVLGASGSISAVSGAFLALFPRSKVTMVLWLVVFVDFFEVNSMWLILLSFAQDLVFQLAGSTQRVAYPAHITGNLFGFAVGMALLVTRILPHEPFDFLSLLDRWRRRRMLATLAGRGASPWLADALSSAGAPSDSRDPQALRRIADLRAAVASALQDHQPQQALDLYTDLLNIDSCQVMSRQTQLDLANYAIRDGRHHLAARTYDLFLKTYPADEYAPEVRLMLGLIYARHLLEPDLARPLLQTSVQQLADPARRRTAEQALGELP